MAEHCKLDDLHIVQLIHAIWLVQQALSFTSKDEQRTKNPESSGSRRQLQSPCPLRVARLSGVGRADPKRGRVIGVHRHRYLPVPVISCD